MSLVGVRVFSLALLVALGGIGRSPRVAAQETVEVRAIAILACTDHDRIDPRLKELAEQLRKKFPEWRGYEIADQSKATLQRGRATTLKLVGDLTAKVTWNGFDAEGRTVLTVKLPTLEEFTYSCCCTKFLPVVTRHKTPEGKHLIVSLSVQPCEKFP